MRIYFLITLLPLLCYQSAKAQSGSETLLSEIESKLKTGSVKVSAILTDNKYVSLHPETSFRELIKKHCTSDPVRIA